MRNKQFMLTCIYYTLIFMGTSGLISYISLFYAEVNSSDTEIGILTTIGAIIGIIANPFWGVRGDRAKTKNGVLSLCLLASAALVWLYPLFGTNFGLLLLVTCLFSFFKSAINPLSDAISLELATQEKFAFSKVRTAGSLGFAIMSMVAGSLVEFHISSIFVIYSLTMVAAFFVFMRMPVIKGHQERNQKVHFLRVLKSPSIRKIYLYVLILSTAFGFFGPFHALYSVEQGISVGLLGIGIMLGSFSQFPFMFYFDKLYAKLGIRKIILISGGFSVVRWLLYALWLNPYTILFLWLLHGGSFILIYLCLAEYVHRHIRKELKVSGQMMNSIIIMGAGQVIGGIGGGVCAEWLGYGTVFAILGLLCLVGILYFWVITRKNPALLDEYSIQ